MGMISEAGAQHTRLVEPCQLVALGSPLLSPEPISGFVVSSGEPEM